MIKRLPPVFVDTSAWIDIAQAQPRAVAYVQRLAEKGTLLGKAHTSDYVVIEAYSFLLKDNRRERALAFVDTATPPAILLHPSDAALVDDAIERARSRRLKRELTLVDWTTVLLMERHDIRHILTTDRAFAQLGFIVLP